MTGFLLFKKLLTLPAYCIKVSLELYTSLKAGFLACSKASANKRSVDAYGKAVELSVLSYLMDNGDYPSDLSTLEVEYTGTKAMGISLLISSLAFITFAIYTIKKEKKPEILEK